MMCRASLPRCAVLRVTLGCCVSILLLNFAGTAAFDECLFAHGSSNSVPSNYAAADDISATLAAAIAGYNAQPGKPAPPAMFAAVARYDPSVGGPPFVTATGASGFRNSKYIGVQGNVAKRLDRTKIGSCTKSLTSTAVALVVDRNPAVISWSSTLGQLLGNAFAGAYASVNVSMLLGHRAGLIRDFSPSCSGSCVDPVLMRQLFAKQLLATSPAVPIGSFQYSNAGYVLAGFLVDKFSGTSYEAFVANNIFSPLGLTSAGFGTFGVNLSPETDYSVAYGHLGNAYSYSTTPLYGAVAAWFNPPGTAYMHTADHAMWAGYHLRAALGGQTIGGMSRTNMLTPHTNVPGVGGPYAMGWINYTSTTAWPGANAIWHNGVINGWYAIQWVMPALRLAVTVEMNVLYLDSAGSLQWNDALLEAVAKNLTAAFTIPTCLAAVAPGPQVNRAGNMACVVTSASPQAGQMCTAGFGNTGIQSTYQWHSATAGAFTWQQCANVCLTNAGCKVWSFGPSSGALSQPGDATCITVTSTTLPVGRKLQSLIGGGGGGDGTTLNLGTYSCSSTPGWVSAQVAGALGIGPYPGQGRVNQHEAFNVVNGAGSCASSAFECQKQCIAARFSGYGPCASYTYSASLQQCYLYKNTGSAQAVALVPMCDLYTGTVSSCA